MVTIIYGENTKDSRNFLHSYLLTKEDKILLTSDAISITELTQIFDGTSLFETKKTVVLEDYLSKARKSKEKDTIVTYLAQKASDHDIVFWDSKELTPTSYKAFTKPTLKQFSYPKSIFLFLDNLVPRNSEKLISLHHTVLKTTEPEIVLFMLARHVRLLLTSHDQSDTVIEEWKRLSPWQKDKIIKQSRKFSQEKLISIHKTLYTLDKKQKTGELGVPLSSAIDFLLSAI